MFFFLLVLGLAAASDPRVATWTRRMAPYDAAVARDAIDDVDTYVTPAQSAQRIHDIFIEDRVPCRIVLLGRSAEGRDIVGIRFTAANATAPRPTVVYFGPVHGDEYAGAELLARFVDHVHAHHASPAVQAMLDAADVVVVPHPNPDGFVSLRRGLADGADMNRAFFPDRCGAAAPPGPERAEVAAAKRFFAETAPVAALFMHGGALVVSYPYDDECTKHGQKIAAAGPDAGLYVELATAYARENAMMRARLSVFPGHVVNGAQWYSAPATLADWALANVSALVVPLTVELGRDKIPTRHAMDAEIWPANYPALLTWPLALRRAVRGYVHDAEGRPIPGAIVSVMVGDGRLQGKAVTTGADGSFYRPLAGGGWRVCASKPMYAGHCFEVAGAKRPQTTDLRFVLRPAGA